MKPAPIVLFVYNRLFCLQQTIEALQKNELAVDSELYIYSDGPKSEDDLPAVNEVRKYIKTVDGFKNINIIKREHNLGLANNIIDGVTTVVNEYERVIVVEDDLVSSPYFLKYLNDSLEIYKNQEKVISIHGYIYPIPGLPETFFIRGADCWGWATWKIGWDLFERNGNVLLKKIEAQGLSKEFDFNNSFPYTAMLRQTIETNYSWAVLWYASAFIHDKLTLYPGRSLVNNIGSDGSGTNVSGPDLIKTEISEKPVIIQNIPIEENKYARKVFAKYLLLFRKPLYKRLWNRSKSFLKKLLRLLICILVPKPVRSKINKLIISQGFNPKFLGLFINPFYFSRKGLYQSVKSLSTHIYGDTLDVGCGSKPYKSLFKVSSYIGLDYDKEGVNKNLNADYFYDGTVFPFKESFFDSVICSEVLEHVFNPNQFISELNRVLKPGGSLLITVPFVWDEHEQPYDYARYSSFGLKHILEKHGFEIVILKKSMNDIRVVFQLINAYIYKKVIKNNYYFNLLVTVVFMSPFNILGTVLNWIFPKNNDLYLDSIILARKVS